MEEEEKMEEHQKEPKVRMEFQVELVPQEKEERLEEHQKEGEEVEMVNHQQ